MRLVKLREEVLEANLELVRQGLVLSTFGNASGISREERVIVIKPSGVPYDRLRPEDLVMVDLDGKILEGELRPSSDLPTHLVLYREFECIGGIAHTHSEHATAWAQARKAIPCFGTTHADYFHGPVPVTEAMSDEEIASNYEENTGRVIIRELRGVSPESLPGILVANHGPFTWGVDARAAAHHAVILESIARMAFMTTAINPVAECIGRGLHDKHYRRKHGPQAYYGQGNKQ